MKKIVTMSLMMLAAGLLTWMPQADAGERSYLMMCQGGGNMVATVVGRGISIIFTKSPYAASQRGPGPGQCAWMDRPLNNEEPAALQFYGDSYHYQATVTYHNQTVSGNFEPSVIHRDLRIQSLIDAVKNGRQFYVHAHLYRNLQFLEITRVGR